MKLGGELLLVLAACGGSTDGTTTDAGSASSSTSGAVTTPTVNMAELGGPCGDGGVCSATCAFYPGLAEPHCGPSNPCDAIACPSGEACAVAESYPPQVGCEKMH